MTRGLIVRRASPGATVQDMGRAGCLGFGLSRGGAMDTLAVAEGAALLGQKQNLACLELALLGGAFEATEDLRIALSGAPMSAVIDGTNIAWGASHLLPKGSVLEIGSARDGIYGYLSVGGGFDAPACMGSRSTHLAAGLGAPVAPGATLPVGPDSGAETNTTLPHDARFQGGTIRVLPSLQTHLFDDAEIARFEQTVFRKTARANRMGANLTFEGAGFAPDIGLSILSEVVLPGDIQITGDGSPMVLLAECQTVGGYPRIGSILPSDLPRVSQAPAGADLRFAFISLETALTLEARANTARDALPKSVTPLVRDPRRMRDLLSYQLISGVTNGVI